MTHTPGPWELKQTKANWAYVLLGKEHTRILPIADARLIAAAPDLLTALQKLKWVSIEKDNMEFKCETTCFVLDEIHAAIAKATGAS